MSFSPNKLLRMKPRWVTSHCVFPYAGCILTDLIELHNDLGPCTQPWFNGHGLIQLQLSLVKNLVFLTSPLLFIYSGYFFVLNCQKTMLAKIHFGCLTLDKRISLNGMELSTALFLHAMF